MLVGILGSRAVGSALVLSDNTGRCCVGSSFIAGPVVSLGQAEASHPVPPSQAGLLAHPDERPWRMELFPSDQLMCLGCVAPRW